MTGDRQHRCRVRYPADPEYALMAAPAHTAAMKIKGSRLSYYPCWEVLVLWCRALRQMYAMARIVYQTPNETHTYPQKVWMVLN
jgi:hypothetical protein